MITFNIDPESSKTLGSVAKRLASVFYFLGIMCWLGVIVMAITTGSDTEGLFVGFGLGIIPYAIGWAFRYVITGNKNYLFKEFFEKQFSSIKESLK